MSIIRIDEDSEQKPMELDGDDILVLLENPNIHGISLEQQEELAKIYRTQFDTFLDDSEYGNDEIQSDNE